MSGKALVQSLVRGLEIMATVSASDGGVKLREIAEELGVSRPTAFNLARTLVAKGYVVKTRPPVRYRVGPMLDQLFAQRRNRRLSQALETAVRSLFGDFDKVWVFAAEPRLGETVVTLRLDPARPAVLERPLHHGMPAYTTAAALAVYAFGGEAEQQAVENRYPFDEFGVLRWRTRRAFEKSIADARRRGLVLLEAPQYRVVAPVWSEDGELCAVLGLSFGGNRTPSRQEKTRAAKAIVAAADEAARQL